MQSLFFWKDWLKEYRIIWYVAIGIFIFSFIFLWFANFTNPRGVIHWEKLQEQKVIEATVHTFRAGPFTLNVPAESYVIYEYFHGSNIDPNTTASYLFLFILVASSVLILTVITTIEKFWYFIGMALFILFIISLRLEVIGLFGLSNKIPSAVVLGLFVLPSFYFNRINPSTPFVYRLITFSLIAIVITLCIALFSSVQYPFYHLTLTAYTSGLILSLLFIILVAHDILGSFVRIVGQGSTHSLRHLSLISAIYLVNVGITCFHELGVIDWNFIYIPLYLLLTISALVGLWEFKNREPVYNKILTFSPFGAYFFVALGAVCLATVGQLLANANDPALKIIRDITIFSHTGFGLIFITYLFSNFVLMLARNMNVYKVLYNPTRMPYFTYQLAGLIATLGFVFYSNWREYVYHGFSGFYNTAGDLYTLIGNEAYAESFYEQGKSQGFQNHRSNYQLGNIKAERFNFEGAHYHFGLANAKRPTEFSLVNAGNIFIWENNAFAAIKKYKEGLRLLPASGILHNNRGFAFAKVRNLDSALINLNTAREYSISKETAETNFFALAAQELLPLKADSILKVFNTSATGTLSNALALSTLFPAPFSVKVDPLPKEKLHLHTASLLNNYIIKNAKLLDTTFLHQAYAVASDSLNEDFSEALKASLAFSFYHQGNITKALEILGELAYISQSYQGRFNYIMGLWALEQRNPLLAASYFSYADEFEFKQAKLYHAIALTEARQLGEALSAWDTVSASRDADQRQIATSIKKILTLNSAYVHQLNDADKYQFARYRISLSDSVFFNNVVKTFTNPNYKAQALLDRSQAYLQSDLLVPAIVTYSKIGGLPITDNNLFENIRHFELLLLAQRGEIRLIANQINKGISFDASRSLEKMLFTALIAEQSGNVELAGKNYEVLSTYNPYFEEGIIFSSNFFRKLDEKSMKPYNILAEAIQINGNSIRLLKAYIAEASRLDFDEYASSAAQRLNDLITKKD